MKNRSREEYKSLFLASNGNKLSSGLFKETCRRDEHASPIFSLEDWHDIYVEIADPTEYKTAMVLVGDWEHWLFLLSNTIILQEVEKWREEVAVKLRSVGVERLKEMAKQENGVTAARWLAEKGWTEAKKNVPKNKTERKIADDMKRLGISVVGGR